MEKRLADLIDKAVSRRSFLAGAGTAAAVTAIGCGGSSTPAPTTTTTPTPTTTPAPTAASGPSDIDILNFALNLEYLEAEFYLRAATGTGLTAADTGNATTTVVAPATTLIPNLTTTQKAYIYEIAQNELDHVRFLRSALGSAAVSRPNIDLMNSFNAAAAAAGIGPAFNPFGSYQAFLVGAFVFEDVGVTAYQGAASLLSTTTTGKAYLAAAASILAVEAYHAAEIRTLLIADSVMNATTAGTTISPTNTYVNLANMISTLRGNLGGGKETPITPLPAYSTSFDPTKYTPASSIVAADSKNSIAYARTTDQVLHIVYASAAVGVKSGGFFPNGLNGNISATTT